MYLAHLIHILLQKNKKKKQLNNNCLSYFEEVVCGKTVGHKNVLKPAQVFPSKELAFFH